MAAIAGTLRNWFLTGVANGGGVFFDVMDGTIGGGFLPFPHLANLEFLPGSGNQFIRAAARSRRDVQQEQQAIRHFRAIIGHLA